MKNLKKRKRLSEKGLKKIAKMQNLSQNEFNQIVVICGLSRDEIYKIEHQRNISEEEQEYLRKLVRILNDKEEHSLYDRDDFDYYGIIII